MNKHPIERLSDILLDVTLIPVLAMMIHVTADVAMKYTLNQPIQGTLETVATYYMVATVVLPIAFIEWTRTPIMVDLFYDMMPKSVQKILVAIALFVSAIAYLFLAINNIPATIRAYQIHELVSGPLSLLVWPSRIMLPISFFIAAMVCSVHLWRFMRSASAREELTSHAAAGEHGVE